MLLYFLLELESNLEIEQNPLMFSLMGHQNLGFFLFSWLLLLSLVPLCMARFVVEKNSLRVTSPEKIRGTYDSAIGNFGIPQYGGSLAGVVVYPKENQKGCKDFSDFHISFQSKPGSLPIFVMVDRGGNFCFGVLVIVVPLCVLMLLVMKSYPFVDLGSNLKMGLI